MPLKDLLTESISSTSVRAKHMDAGTGLVGLFNLLMESCRETVGADLNVVLKLI